MVDEYPEYLINRNVLKAPKDTIIEFIKISGGATVGQISKELSLTSTNVRQHLASLERDQLITSKTIKQGAGRPKILYTLTESAANLFPKRYDFLLSMVLNEIENMDGPEKIDDIFNNITDKLYFLCFMFFEGLSTEEKLEKITSMAKAWGSMAEWKKLSQNQYVLYEYNCNFYNSLLTQNLLEKFAVKLLKKLFNNADIDYKIEKNPATDADIWAFYVKT